MFSEVLDRATQITGGEDGWASLPGFNKDKSQKAFLADELIRLTKADDLKWSASFSKHIILTTTGDFIVVLTRHTQAGGRYIGGTISFYCLVVFRNEQEVLSLNDRCDDNDYTSSSRRVPVMDVYDVATTGKVRRPRTAHVCGASGFGQSLSDSCPACEGK